jgi:hypothetical protein
MQYLKADTATTIRIGPFVDDTDGVTAETALTIAQADVRLSKGGAVAAQKNDATSATHDEAGYYRIPLNTTDTNTEGSLDVCVSETGSLPVIAKFTVLPAAVYDSLIAGTDVLASDVTQVSGSSVSGVNDFKADLSSLNDPTAADVATAVWNKDISTYANAGEAGTLLKVTEANTDDLKTTTVVKADVVSISGDSTAANNLESYCDGTTPMPVNMTQISGDSTAADTLESYCDGTTPIPSNTTQVAGSSVAGVNDFKADVSGLPSAASIADAVWDESQSAHTTAGTFGEYLDAAVSGVSTGGVSAADIADAVWDEALSGHTSAGSAGKALADTETDADSAATGVAGLNDPSAATIASAVRSELATELARIDADITSRAAAGDAMTLTSGERNSIAAALLDLANGIETGITPRESLRAILSVLCGKVSGMDVNSPVFRSAIDSANRVSATTDADGNRSAITLNLT